MKKIFVTGGTGFIGQALTRRFLKEGWGVVSLARSEEKAKATGLKKVKWIYGDICEKSWHGQAKGCRVFVHLVGVHGHKRLSYQERVAVELGGTQSAVSAAKQAEVDHFIFIGTAYDQMETEYGQAKRVARGWIEKQIKKGFPATIVCPVTVYGPGDLVNLHRLFRAIKKGRFVFIGDGKNQWQWLYIDDLIEALILVLQNREAVRGKTLTIASEQSIPLKKLVDLIAKEERTSFPKIYLPKEPMLLLGRFFSFLAKFGLWVPFTQDTVITMTSSHKHRPSGALERLGFKTKIKLREGVKKAIIWYERSRVL